MLRIVSSGEYVQWIDPAVHGWQRGCDIGGLRNDTGQDLADRTERLTFTIRGDAIGDEGVDVEHASSVALQGFQLKK